MPTKKSMSTKKNKSTKKHPKTFEEARKLARNTQMAFYILSAIKLGISYKIVIPGLFVEFSKGKKLWRVHKALTPLNDSVSMSLASYKNTCNRFLLDKGYPVPAQASVNSAEDILKFMKEKKAEKIVVKPKRGFGGAGVTIQPDTEQEIRAAFNFAHQKCMATGEPKVLVEEFIVGRHFRMVVLGDKLIAASERMPPSVVGDGKSTIKKLILKVNKEHSKKGLPPIKLDTESEKTLGDQNLTIDSVPKNGETIIVRFNANLTSGGTVRECLKEVHPDYAKMAVSVVQEIGLRLGGLDVITPDITDPKVKYGINEVNHNPGLRIHYLPDEGEPVDIATTIQQYMLDNL